MQKKLVVIDDSDYVNRWQAFSWFSSSDVITLLIGSIQELIDELIGFVNKRMVFDRVVFRTHGDTGVMWLGDDQIHSWDWSPLADKIKFSSLFPGPTKIYFDGCDLAKGETGTNFLTKAGQTLLRGGGGSTLGWTSLGFAVPGIIPFIGGHTVHTPNYENLKILYFKSGGLLVSVTAAPSNDVDVWGDKGKYQKPNIGNKI